MSMDARDAFALVCGGALLLALAAMFLELRRRTALIRHSEASAQELNRHEYALTNKLIEAERVAVRQMNELQEARKKLSAVERAKGKLYTVEIENKQALVVRLRRTIERTRTITRGAGGRDALARMRAIDEISQEALGVFNNETGR